MDRLSNRVLERVRGVAWNQIRGQFMSVCEKLLAVSSDSFGELTTIYVKFTLTNKPSSPVYAAVWLKNAKSITVGFSLAADFEDSLLIPPPQRMTYRGLTRYFVISPEVEIPARFDQWAEMAFARASQNSALPINERELET